MPLNNAARTALLVAAAAVLLGTLAFLYSRTEAIDFKRDAQVLSLLRELRDLDTRWDADASRLATAPPGAPAPADRSSSLARILRELDGAASARPEVAAALPGIRQGMAEKGTAWAALKEKHSRTAEALAAATAAATALATQAGTLRLKDPRQAERYTVVAGEAGQLVAAARLLDADTTPSGLFETRLATLKEAASTADPGLAALGAGAETALRDYLAARAEERKAEQKFNFLTVGSRVEQLAQSLSRGIEVSLEDKERWRVYLFFYAAALLVGVGYLAARVVAAQAALKAANESLEKRVVERTKELSEALVKLKESEAQLVQSEKMS